MSRFLSVFVLLMSSGCVNMAENLRAVTLQPETTIRVHERAVVAEPQAVDIDIHEGAARLEVLIDTEPLKYGLETFADGFNQMALMLGEKAVNAIQKELGETSRRADERMGEVMDRIDRRIEDAMRPLWALVITLMAVCGVLVTLIAIVSFIALRWYVKDKKSEIRHQNGLVTSIPKEKYGL